MSWKASTSAFTAVHYLIHYLLTIAFAIVVLAATRRNLQIEARDTI